ncbi:phosphoribosyltransferase family protein [Cryobacterium sp. PH31-AA6]|uniref:phosphoribosyltransferase n=1 Tax=Cryobacterium sp. PH31-AA6 TaxID=3046205 RepID=UPI0024B98079|nr:phosphoribosyltransferase family protein [Cryobacterium sp. PH31-AA6]MDJ0322541.1 phosphoribosyltransferase family protein [Cryobacterium sp. PH31-AA6]
MFTDRSDAGRRLAERVAALRLLDPVVYAVPRGGVPVAIRIAEKLHAPLDLLFLTAGAHGSGRGARRRSAPLENRIRYLGDRAPISASGRDAVIVDDGMASGATMRAALAEVRKQGAALVVVAVPVAPARVCAELGPIADQVVVLETPAEFWAIGPFYKDFHQLSDEETVDLLGEHWAVA